MHVRIPEVEMPRSLVCPRERAAYREEFVETFRRLAEAGGATALPQFGHAIPSAAAPKEDR